MKQPQKYRNIGAKRKIQSNTPPKYVYSTPHHVYVHNVSQRDRWLRRRVEDHTRKTGGKQPKRFAKWLIFLLRIIRLNKDI
jgi:hypothetical protein